MQFSSYWTRFSDQFGYILTELPTTIAPFPRDFKMHLGAFSPTYKQVTPENCAKEEFGSESHKISIQASESTTKNDGQKEARQALDQPGQRFR